MTRKQNIRIDNIEYTRLPLKTKILTDKDDILEIAKLATKDILIKGDILTISESPLAITQGRAIPVKNLKIGFLAKFLWRFVKKTNYGIGLRAASSMQCAIDECGAARILFAAFVGFLGKLIGRSGDFYRIAGKQAALIDAAFTSPVPPFDECVIKGPKDPDKVAQKIKNALGCETAVMDINDIGGCWVIGASDGANIKFLEKVMKDNPQGQADELTPFCVIRKAQNQ